MGYSRTPETSNELCAARTQDPLRHSDSHVEYEQKGAKRAEYGESLLKKLAGDLTVHYGRGFGWRNLFQMRAFFLASPPERLQTPSAIPAGTLALVPEGQPSSRSLPAAPAISPKAQLSARCPLPWSASVRPVTVTQAVFGCGSCSGFCRRGPVPEML
ncbi:MAG: DUF1016 N-terminal domain-containing protein [Planctomycetota bacterium]